jgi:Coenzyme PQQ synthesis protein D (PqqD)
VNIEVHDESLLVRRLDVTARVPDQVTDLLPGSEGGLLIETLIGRYVLNADGRSVWKHLDGRRDLAAVVAAVAAEQQEPDEQVREAVRDLCIRLVQLGLLEPQTSPAAGLGAGSA